ncbi:MAG: S9 family peptidase [Hyphomicrobiales bacterium]|nr:S9 family peptidase [Hyphomicrobiales bacterium]
MNEHLRKARPAAPRAERRPVATTVHGHRLVDDYAWLRADNWQAVLADPDQTPPDIRAHLEAENAYCDALLAPTQEMQRLLVGEMRARMKEDDARAPAPDGPFDYFTRYRAGGQYPLICRRPRGDATAASEAILIDGDARAQGCAFYELSAAEHSPDHALIAWSFDDKGSELHQIRVRDIARGIDLPDLVTRNDGAIVWDADGRSFLYVRVDDNHRTAQVFRHRLGADESADELVVEEKDPRWFVHLSRAASGRFAIVTMRDHDGAECWLVDLHDTTQPARLVAARERGLRYDVEHFGDELIIRTNADGAADFKLMSAPLASPARANWRERAPHVPGRMIVGHDVYARHLVRLEREGGLPRIVVTDWASGAEHVVAFDEEAYSLSLQRGYEFDTNVMRFVYSSMTTPEETYDYDMATRTRTLVKRQEIPSGHDPKKYRTRRIFARAADGAEVPVSILERADRAGPAPLLLYAYGSYGHSIPAAFGANRFSLVDRGFVYAIAHIRGGTDKGWNWYEQGKLQNKPNTFSDYVASAQTLIDQGFTRQGAIVAQGGSAGGMLMGAVANMAPQLFAGVIADVPFVDVINTMLDKDLPLTPPEWLEWGNPIEDAKAFATMLSYSPYDNVRAQAYPPILALGGLTDPRVTYWEPAKWVARLRERMTGGGPVMLRTNMHAGHGGAAGRFDRLQEIALEYAFAIEAAKGSFSVSG